MDDYQFAIQPYIDAMVRAHNARIEQACEEALTGGECGVLVQGDVVSVDERVPYGTIWHVPPGAEIPRAT